jgi:hypothetical protein
LQDRFHATLHVLLFYSPLTSRQLEEPLSRLLESCENEAHLNTMGRCALSQDILQLLINRLHIQRDREEWPWIAAEAITAPANNGAAAHRGQDQL